MIWFKKIEFNFFHLYLTVSNLYYSIQKSVICTRASFPRKKMKAKIPLILLSIGLLILCVTAKNNTLELQILHNNDMHSRFEQTNQTGGNCSKTLADANQCYGGMARVSYVVKEYRNKAKNGGTSVLYLNAGDTYNGTFWWALFRDQICTDYLNILKPDVMVS